MKYILKEKNTGKKFELKGEAESCGGYITDNPEELLDEAIRRDEYEIELEKEDK